MHLYRVGGEEGIKPYAHRSVAEFGHDGGPFALIARLRGVAQMMKNLAYHFLTGSSGVVRAGIDHCSSTKVQHAMRAVGVVHGRRDVLFEKSNMIP